MADEGSVLRPLEGAATKAGRSILHKRATYAVTRKPEFMGGIAMRACVMALYACVYCLSAEAQITEVQSDWSGGPNVFGPVQHWGDRCLMADDAAWRPIAGQVALACTPLDPPVQYVIAGDADHPQHCGVGDVDGDGDPDVLTTDPLYDLSQDLGGVYWWECQTDDTWIQHTVDGDFYGAGYVASADVDGDGDQDVIAAAYYGNEDISPEGWRNGRYAWFENLAGDGSAWTQHLVGELFWGARWIDAGDLDGDGDVDLVGASELTDGVWEEDGDITWFENQDGVGTQWAQHDLETERNSAQAHAVDLDGDGDLDVMSGEQDRIGWWENRHGDGTLWIKRYVSTELSSSAYLDAGDLDDDGDLDIVGGAYHTNVVIWWENTAGDGTVWFPRYVVSGLYISVLYLRDIDGDGDLDAALAGGLSDGFVYWLENTSGDGIVWNPRLITSDVEGYNWLALGDVNDDARLDAVVVDEGIYESTHQIAWHDLTYFVSAGELVSSVLDGGVGRWWGVIDWDVLAPSGTTAGVAVRASNDPYNLGLFVDVPAPGMELAAFVDPGARYLQYKLDLATTNDSVSPIVHELAVAQHISGDADGDSDVDLGDFSVLAECLSGPQVIPDTEPPPSAEECLQAFDFDLDQDVDLHDWATFSIGFTGE
jgi:hypothetical protein